MNIKTDNHVRLGSLEAKDDTVYYLPYDGIKMTEYMLEQALKRVRQAKKVL